MEGANVGVIPGYLRNATAAGPFYA
jgi:hypothetical protein